MIFFKINSKEEISGLKTERKNISNNKREDTLKSTPFISKYMISVIWLYGLSGSGKSTLSNALNYRLKDSLPIKQLDGDDLRAGLNSNLGFSDADRIENIRRSAEVTKLFVNSGFTCICSFITPSEEARSIMRSIIGKENLLEVFVDAPLDICKQRDPKGLYKRVADGKINHFSGISSSFETPIHQNITLNTETLSINECIDIIINYLKFENKPVTY